MPEAPQGARPSVQLATAHLLLHVYLCTYFFVHSFVYTPSAQVGWVAGFWLGFFDLFLRVPGATAVHLLAF